jgi:hypothetical protein
MGELYSITFVGSCEQRRRQIESKRLSGLEIDRQFLLGAGRFGCLVAFEDTVDVARRSTKWMIGRIRPAPDQAAVGDEDSEWIDRRQPAPSRKHDD